MRIYPGLFEDGYVYEHRLVMMDKLDRLLEPDELVHHRNGVRFDNREENLQVTDKKGHEKSHPIWNRGIGTKWKRVDGKLICLDPEAKKRYDKEYSRRNRDKRNAANRRYRKRKRAGLV